MYRVHDVFISYRRKETDGREQGFLIAQAIYNHLTSKGLQVFWDKERMENGPFPEQLDWQVRHAPNFIFIGTDAALHFRPGPEPDYVAEEVKIALQLYKDNPNDRTILPIIPFQGHVPGKTDESYPVEIREMFDHNAPSPLDGRVPSEKNLKEIHAKVTAVSRGNLWNAGYRWYNDVTSGNARFASLALDIDQRIMPLAGSENRKGISLSIHTHLLGKQDVPLMDMIAQTSPKHLYLIGEGGIGKTTSLFSIMKQVYTSGQDENDIERNRMNGQVPLFVELSRAPDTYGRLYEGGRSTFIQRAVYQQIRTDLKVKQVSKASVADLAEVFELDPETAVKPIHDLFTQATPAPEYLLLLDGLNEVSRVRIQHACTIDGVTKLDLDEPVISMVLKEIHQLMTDCPNVRVILTSRSKEMADLGVNTEELYLSGVQDDVMECYLMERRVSDRRIEAVRQNEKLKEILKIPLFLTLYATLKGNDEILTRGEILHHYFSQKKKQHYSAKSRAKEIEQDAENAAADQQYSRLTAQMQCFVLDFILPKIAWKMVQAQEFHISHEFLGDSFDGLDRLIEEVLTDDSDNAVCGRFGRQVFADYRSASMAGQHTKYIADEMKKRLGGNLATAIPQIVDCAVMTLGILYTNNGDEYGFIHHHIRDYFAALYQINCLRLGTYLQSHRQNEMARQCLRDWKAHPLYAEVRRFIGEALGEAHNAPFCDETGNWHYNVPEVPCERNLVKRAFDLFKYRFDGQDGFCVWNLLQVLKETRCDLCGEALTGLDLFGCECNGFSLGHLGCAASLKGSKVSEAFFMPKGHSQSVNSAIYSPDGSRIITASADKTAKVWDVLTLQEVGTLKGHTKKVNAANYSHDGSRIVTASSDNTVKVWDALTLQEVATLTGHTQAVYSTSFSPDGNCIISASYDGTVRIWDALSFQELSKLRGHSNLVNSVSYSPNGRRIVTASFDGTAKVWDALTSQEVGTLRGHCGYVNTAMYSPDGSYIITSSRDCTAKVWDALKLQEISTLTGFPSEVCTGCYSPDGRLIVTSFIEGAKVWDALTYREIGTLKGHVYAVNSASFSPDSNHIITASYDGTVKVWDALSLQELGNIPGHADEINTASYSSDGNRIVIASDDSMPKIWDAQSLRELGALKGHSKLVSFACFSPDGSRILTASYDNTAKVWDARSLKEVGTLKGHNDWVCSVNYSPDGHLIVTASYDNTAKIWDAMTLHEVGVLKGHSQKLNLARFSPDGRCIVTTSWDGTAKVWDALTQKEIGTLGGHSEAVTSASYSPNGSRIVTASDDGILKIWDTHTLQEIHTLQWQRKRIQFVCYSPDGSHIVTASGDNTARIWDASTLQKFGTLKKHSRRVNSASYNPDSTSIITASFDSTAKIWDRGADESERVQRSPNHIGRSVFVHSYPQRETETGRLRQTDHNRCQA